MKTSTKQNKNLVEVARSFSYKLNLGNYQTGDFFCSQKAEVPKEQAEEKSEELYRFCRKEVEKSIRSFLLERKPDGNNIWDVKRQEIYNREAEIQDEAGRLCQHGD